MKAQTAKGTRDFSPIEVKKREYIIQTIKGFYELYGYLPIETPAIENLSTLTGKYGEEGDQLLFKILNSRLHEHKNKEKLLSEFNKMLDKSYNSEDISERALRYDLTVPFARYVSQYRHQITFPFKRYQVQPVWRADKPQKGRYREFIQCDVDCIGSTSLLCETELVLLINQVFEKLNLNVVLKLNHRKLLIAIIEHIGAGQWFNQIVTLIDKLDKVDSAIIKQDLIQLGLNTMQIEQLFTLISVNYNAQEKLQYFQTQLNSESAKKAIEDLNFIFNLIDTKKMHIQLDLDVKLARGLNYYTGTIFEVKALTDNFSASILGGGRYDDLTGIFDFPNISGVGVSFGIDRIYDVMNDLNLFPESLNKIAPAKVLISYTSPEYITYALNTAQNLRNVGIATELYHQADKLKKQFEYANKKQFPYIIIIGDNEVQGNILTIKNMNTSEQKSVAASDVIKFFINNHE